ncbi:MAG: hypothetical protein KC469_02285 [Flavobacteriaceae bacterium]|nr:hypothetical protein [Flavobacteriaceae bacterium]
MKSIFFILLLISSTISHAQPESIDNVIGQNYTFASKILNEDRTIQIYTPSSYSESLDKNYPVLYILDGQRLFLDGVSVVQSFTSQFQLSPDIIVVGINNKYPDRFNHFLGTNFLDFIENEVVSYIEDQYRTSKERLLFGWEYAGAFVIESMIKRPQLFNAHLAASPYPIHEKWFNNQSRIDMLEAVLDKELTSYLYVTISANEGMVEDGTNELEALLKSKATENLRWDYRVIEGAEHTSTAYPGIYHGLRSYYHNYKKLQFNSLSEFKDKGGIAHVYEYYKGRAERFGFSEDLPPWTMFSLSRNAIRADSFTDFESLMNEFKGKGMINNIRLDRAMSLASYYSKYNKYHDALFIYEQLITKNRDSAILQNAIGDVYVMLKENKKAKPYYKKAIALAKAQKDAKLVDYQNDLKRIK